MPKIAFEIGNVNDKLSIAFAMAQGYRFTLHGDGNAEVVNSDGKTYHVRNFGCDCPDKTKNGGSYNSHCKHEYWVCQLLPCELCGATMGLGAFHTCFGGVMERFECAACGNARDFDLVRAERRLRKQSRMAGAVSEAH